MAKKSKGMTLKEHVELGNELKAIRKKQFYIANKITIAYGKTSQAGRRALAWCANGNMLDKIICEMDNIVVRETNRNEWEMNGYGWIYMGGEIETFIECQNCEKIVNRDRVSQSIVDGSTLCPACEKKHNDNQLMA